MGLPSDTDDRAREGRANRKFFLVLDGPDGGGKSTQIARLAEWLRSEGFDVMTCRDPGGTGLGERVRGILLERKTVSISLRAEMLLYMASRAQLVEEVIRPALEAGRVVISDRFTYANIVYQGYAGGLGVREVSRIGEMATGGLEPDLTLILDVPTEVARARTGGSRDRMEDRALAFHQKVREGYLSAARESEQSLEALDGVWLEVFSARTVSPIVVIDATAEPDVVFRQLKGEVERGLAFGARS